MNSESHRADERLLSSYVVFCNRVEYRDGINFWGGPTAVRPDGNVLALARLFDEDLLIARIDDHEIRPARRFSRHFPDDDPRLMTKELERISRSQP